MAAFKTNPGLGGAYSSFRGTPRPKFQTNPGLGGAFSAFRGRPAAPTTSPVSPVAAAAAAAPGAGPQAPAPGAPDVRDSAFNSGVNGLLFHNKQSRDGLTAQGAQAGEDFNTMLSRMADNRAQSLLAQNYGANKQGLFYSGQLGKRRDDTNKGYDQQQADAQSSFDRANAAREAALQQLGQFTVDPNSPTGYAGTGQAGIDLGDLFSTAIGRQAARDANGGGDLAAAAQEVTPAQQLAAAPAAAVGIPAATSSGPQGSGPAIKIAASKEHGGKKWIYHRAANGTWIPVRPA